MKLRMYHLHEDLHGDRAVNLQEQHDSMSDSKQFCSMHELAGTASHGKPQKEPYEQPPIGAPPCIHVS